MKKKRESKFFKWGLTAFVVIAAGISFYYIVFHSHNIRIAFRTIVDILMPVVFGLVIAYLLTPVLNFLEYKILRPICDRCKIKDCDRRNSILRGIGIISCILLFFSLIYGLVFMLISQIVPSITNIAANFDTYVGNFTKWLNKLLEDNPQERDYVLKVVNTYFVDLDDWMNNTLLEKTSEVIKTVSLSVIGMLKVLWNLIIGLIISIYVMASKEKFAGQVKKSIFAFFENNTANIIINNFNYTHKTFSGFISGKVLDSIIIGCICFVGTSFMNTPYAVLVSVIIGVTNIIPFFGPYLGAIPSIILIFIVDPMHPLNCVYFAVFILVLQQFDGNILGPKILGGSTGLSSFWVIFAITLFGGLWGVFGMIVGVPLFAVFYAAVKSFINSRLEKKKLPTDSLEYTNLCAIDEEGLHGFVPGHMRKSKDQEKTAYGNEFLSTFSIELTGKKLQKSSEPDAEPNVAENQADYDSNQ